MFEIGIIAIIVLFVVTTRQQKRIKRIESDLAAVREALAGHAPVAAAAESMAVAKELPKGADLPEGAVAQAAAVENATGGDKASEPPTLEEDKAEPAVGPWNWRARTPDEQAQETAPSAASAPAARRDIETALGTRWAVWVGGIALALGGLFLVRYTIESGIFGPGVRLTMASILGLVMVAGGEFIRRTGFKVPVQGAAGAYIPAILTAAGAFTLFGAVYAAHGVHGFIGPGLAFGLLGIIGIATIAAALVHGQALAGIGLLGALATPMLVSSQSPNAWALFGYLAILLAATGAIARIRRWAFLMVAAFVGTGLWTLLYMSQTPQLDFAVLLFISAVTLAVLVFLWLTGDDNEKGTPVAPALFLGLSALALFNAGDLVAQGGPAWAAVILVAMVAAALYRPRAVALLYGAGVVTALAYMFLMPLQSLWLDLSAGALSVDGMTAVAASGLMPRFGILLGIVFIGTGFWSARRLVASSPVSAASWAFWGVAAPLVIVLSTWVAFGNIDRDFIRALIALALLIGFVAGAEWIARAEQPPLAGGLAVSFALIGAGVAALLMIHMAFGSGMTTVLLGAAAIVPAHATRWRTYPVLGWLSAGAAVAVLARIGFDPTIVGAEFLSRTSVFNWLLPGYGVPALAFGFAAWQLARTTNGRPRLIMEAMAALFALLTLAMLVRHAMHSGVIDAGVPTLAEQAIYTLIALGAGAILVALDMRSPSSVLRYGSMAAGVVSVLFILGQHFVVLNPLFTDEATGRIPVFNLLFLAYLLPAIAAGALALYARDKRPHWYSAMLAVVAALLLFAYATLSVRRLFKGEFIALWSGMEQLETYSYSALWLAMGVALLAGGVWLRSQVLRIASAALIAVAVLKVFLFDMSELEGVLRALSFIGLGAVLIGIGLFYQRLLTRAARAN
ncbi:membrane-like protein [Mesorhizobium sp. Root157]|uniref:DUF2339 domain-containing protein n=1 Tax=Mesorhizobium sp. Root157 TaxID=1736477 RepID=UPI0006F40F6F|nr:DUF2339 domain-containing protein [Mesorhizobium sp. Root157]KQZ94251.1 membrane-like protein [Mesorhizobium sp. Root157]